MKILLQNLLCCDLLQLLYKYRELLMQVTKRELATKFRGSFLGTLWLVINPLMLLIIYTFVFSVVIKAKWNIATDSNHYEFAMALFCGLISFNIFSETINRSSGIILSNPNYVKKVVFPLEILPISLFLSSLFQSIINFGLLLIGVKLFLNTFSVTALMVPILLLPLMFLTVGISLFISSLGVYIRDIGNIVSVITNALFFLTPVFYPISAIPEKFQKYMLLNPLSAIIDSLRQVILWGVVPNWNAWFHTLLLTIFVFIAGYHWFKLSRKGFADVI